MGRIIFANIGSSQNIRTALINRDNTNNNKVAYLSKNGDTYLSNNPIPRTNPYFNHVLQVAQKGSDAS
jgi:hypothetical protein